VTVTHVSVVVYSVVFWFQEAGCLVRPRSYANEDPGRTRMPATLIPSRSFAAANAKWGRARLAAYSPET